MPPLGIIAWLRADWGDLGRERMKEGKLIKYTMGREREVDEEHMLIQRDNPEERRRAASQIFTGTVDGAQLGWQMAQIAWKCLGGVRRVWSAKTRLIITSLCITWHISSPSPLSPIHLASHRKTVHCSQHGPLGIQGEQLRASTCHRYFCGFVFRQMQQGESDRKL